MLIVILHKNEEEKKLIINFWKENFYFESYQSYHKGYGYLTDYGYIYYCLSDVEKHNWNRGEIYLTSERHFNDMMKYDIFSKYIVNVSIDKLNDKGLFEELAFCLFTPGSKAINGDKAVRDLKSKNLLLAGSKCLIARRLRGVVRFHNNKASYLVEARKTFIKKSKLSIKKKLISDEPLAIREWLAKNIKGLGFKEASHFLRNVGLGENLAILDTHIFKNLKKYNLIDKIPKAVSSKQYLDIECKMREFSNKVHIPLDELDLLFWSNQTGYIFK